MLTERADLLFQHSTIFAKFASKARQESIYCSSFVPRRAHYYTAAYCSIDRSSCYIAFKADGSDQWIK